MLGRLLRFRSSTLLRSPLRQPHHRFFSDTVGVTQNKVNINPNDPNLQPPLKNDEVPPKIQKLADEVGQLTIVELVMFLNATGKKFGLTSDQIHGGMPNMFGGGAPAYYPPSGGAPAAAAPQPAAAPAAAAAPKEEKKEEKKGFSVKMTKVDEGSKYKVLKEFRTLKPGLSIADSKKFVENLPSVLIENVSKEEAEKWSKTITAAGGVCVVE